MAEIRRGIVTEKRLAAIAWRPLIATSVTGAAAAAGVSMKPQIWIAAISTCVVVGGVAHAALSNVADSRVAFQASGPAGMSIEGTTTDLALSDKGDSLVLTVPLGNLTTGIALRDRHMKEKYLEVPKYPAAILSVARAALKLPTGEDKVEADVPTSVTLHGQTRPVVVHYDLKKSGGGLSAHGSFRINMQEFGISVPSYLGVTVKPNVDVNANFRVSDG
jgi:polyisoprenoid-binding protein YceI